MRNFVWRMMGTIGMMTALGACGTQQAGLAADEDTSSMQRLEASTFEVCETTPFIPEQATGFKSWKNAMLSSQGVFPVAQDIVTLPAGDFNITSWFGLGTLRVGANNEDVVAKLDRCGTWDTLGSTVTDKDGRARLSHNVLDSAGRYRLTQQLLADGTTVASTVHVYPAGTHFVVFDIDGTLTTDNGQFVRQQLNPDYVPVAFAGAQAATQAWTEKGYVVLYLTGRPTDAAVVTRGWLDRLGFATGATHLTESPSQMLPTNEGVGTFKRNFLKSLVAKGYNIDYAYGNETTDIFAYAGIGLTPDKIFILGANAGTDGTRPLPTGYTENLPFINGMPMAGQPFAL